MQTHALISPDYTVAFSCIPELAQYQMKGNVSCVLLHELSVPQYEVFEDPPGLVTRNTEFGRMKLDCLGNVQYNL
jgi:hypothetical protein